VKTTQEDTMAMTLLGYRAMMAELRRDALLREAAAARKVRAARAARRQRGSDMAALGLVAAVVIFAVIGGRPSPRVADAVRQTAAWWQ
jgi:hypothetical protein